MSKFATDENLLLEIKRSSTIKHQLLPVKLVTNLRLKWRIKTKITSELHKFNKNLKKTLLKCIQTKI